MTERQIADQSDGMLQPAVADYLEIRLGRTKFMQEADVEALCDEAAVEIKRLRDELAAWQGTVRAHEALAAKAAAEIERLHALAHTQVANNPDDLLQELRDWRHIIDGVQGKAVVMMLSGAVFGDAADEIERLQALCNDLYHDATCTESFCRLCGEGVREWEARRG